MATSDNLSAAFAGESQANRKYLAFAKKADKDGFPQVAKLFRAAAEAETVHAHAHLRVMGGVKTTAENIQAGIEGEGHEFREMYPEFVAEAKKEHHEAAAESFQYAMQVEEIHHGLYQKALVAVGAGKDLPKGKLFVCDYCGNTVEGAPPDKCPICNNPRKGFIEIK